MAAATPALLRELRRVLDEASIPDVVAGPSVADETAARGLVGSADAVAFLAIDWVATPDSTCGHVEATFRYRPWRVRLAVPGIGMTTRFS
jgi:hypothetical protein